MDIQDFFKQIQPDITVLAVLFAFLLLFLKLFWFFVTTYEKEIRDDNLQKVKDLLSNSLESNIVLPLQEELEKNIELGYRYAANLFYPKKWDTASQSNIRQLETDLSVADEIMQKDIKEIVSSFSGQSIATKTGQELFEYLERRYQRTSHFIARYERLKRACIYTYITCLILAALSAWGMILFSFPQSRIVDFWLFGSVLTLIVGIVHFSRMLIGKHQLIKEWEKIQVYGNQG